VKLVGLSSCRLVLPSSGVSSGILLLWDKRVVEKIEVYVGEYVVACSFRNIADDFTRVFAGVYGPSIDSRRRSCCEFKRVLVSAQVICNIVCASARSNPQGNGKKSVFCLTNLILT
jgi:hypothetical protein